MNISIQDTNKLGDESRLDLGPFLSNIEDLYTRETKIEESRCGKNG